MKNRIRSQAILIGFTLLVAACTTTPIARQDRELASAKPYRTALVISGENLNTPLFVGMVDGLIAQGKTPDVIVASCGAAIAAGLVQSIPDRKKRLQFLLSRDYHRLLLSLQMDDPSLYEFGKRLWNVREISEKQRQLIPGGKRWVPDVFSYSLLTIGKELNQSRGLQFDQRFAESGVHVVIVGARVDYSPAEAGSLVPASRKLFTETYFTDEKTARYLNGLPSFPGTSVPSSSVSPETQVITDATLGDAVRASITDPLLVNPLQINGAYYLTGAVNIDPINVAQQLAPEVIARYPTTYDSIIEVPALMSTFAFDGNEVRGKALRSKVDFWIDGTMAFPNFSLGPKPNFLAALKKFNPARTYKFGSRVPESYDEFVKLVLDQYNFGMDRARETLEGPRFDRAHIQTLMPEETPETPARTR